MKKFEIGKTYSTRSACDYECVFSFEVVRRTEKTVWIKDRMQGIKGRRVEIDEGVEMIRPYGSYSMAPIIRAN